MNSQSNNIANKSGQAGQNALAWAKLKIQFFNVLREIHPPETNYGENEALDETTRNEMESVLGFNLGEARIHRSKQAGHLARRFEAEAFTIGNNIYSPEETCINSTTENKALLVHELTHVIQQTRPMAIKPVATKTALSNNQINTDQSQDDKSNNTDMIHIPVIQLAPLTSTESGNSHSQMLETTAQATEQRYRNNVQNNNRQQSKVPIDTEELANLVYRLMQQDMLLERDRR